MISYHRDACRAIRIGIYDDIMMYMCEKTIFPVHSLGFQVVEHGKSLVFKYISGDK